MNNSDSSNPDSKNAGFNRLDLHAELLSNLDDLGFHTMTPIQALSLPKILDGQDVIAQAKTGSGKTAAFGLGILNKLDVKKFKVQCLVLCPTRELADQVEVEIIMDDPASISRVQTPLWDTLQKSVNQPFPNARITPQLIVGLQMHESFETWVRPHMVLAFLAQT